jgi:hypothetical protein
VPNDTARELLGMHDASFLVLFETFNVEQVVLVKGCAPVPVTHTEYVPAASVPGTSKYTRSNAPAEVMCSAPVVADGVGERQLVPKETVTLPALGVGDGNPLPET